MHYEDEEHLKENILKVVVYKHGTEDDNIFHYKLSSIQECRYIQPRFLNDIISMDDEYSYPFFKDILNNHKEEAWYFITLKEIESEEIDYSLYRDKNGELDFDLLPNVKYQYDIISIEDVSNNENNYLKLH